MRFVGLRLGPRRPVGRGPSESGEVELAGGAAASWVPGRALLGCLFAAVAALPLALQAADRIAICDAAAAKGFVAADGGWLFYRDELRAQEAPAPAVVPAMERAFDALAAAPGEAAVVLLPPRPLTIDAQVAGFDREATERAHRAFAAKMRAHGLVVVDLLDLAQVPTTGAPFFLPRDNHISFDGARVAAQEVARVIRGMRVAEAFPAARFQSRSYTTGPKQIDGLAVILAQTCGENPPAAESITRWNTKRVDTPTIGLLDEAPAPPVTLLGTSNTVPGRSNLEGFLQEALGTEVLSVATSGGGWLGSLLAYTRDPAWGTSPPSLVLWEVSLAEFWRHTDGSPDARDPSAWREVVPAVHGGCDDASATKLGAWVPATADSALLTGIAPAGAAGHDWYVLVEARDPALMGFTLELRHADGALDAHVFPPYTRVPTAGRFFLELSDTVGAPLAEVRAKVPAGTTGELRARLCRVPH